MIKANELNNKQVDKKAKKYFDYVIQMIEFQIKKEAKKGNKQAEYHMDFINRPKEYTQPVLDFLEENGYKTRIEYLAAPFNTQRTMLYIEWE